MMFHHLVFAVRKKSSMMPHKKYQWLLFDADDTLFDYVRAEANALRWTLESCGLTFLPEYIEIYARHNQEVWREFERGEITQLTLRSKRFHLFFAEIGMAIEPETVSVAYLQNLARGTDLLPGAEEVIRILRGQYRLALVTNGLKDVQRPRLARSVLHDAFEKIFISEEIGAAKPSRQYFDIVFDTIDHPPKDEVLLIGDSLTSDMRGGIKYGIHTCWYNPRQQHTDLPVRYIIQDLPELISDVLYSPSSNSFSQR